MIEQSRSPPPRRIAQDSRLIVGRLESHGPANYQFRADQSRSYYLKILTNRGERVLWGTDLARAIAESVSQSKTGSLIGVRRTGYETLTIPEPKSDATGQSTAIPRIVRRNQWIVESVQFFADRAQLARRVRDAQADARQTVKTRPELVSTYLSLRGAQELAERRIADPEDRERFLSLVREAMAASIHNGEPLPAIRIRERSKSPEPKTRTARTARSRGEPTR